MTEHDDARALIDRLHEEAEQLAAMARVYDDPARAKTLRTQASRKVREAARLRAQIGED